MGLPGYFTLSVPQALVLALPLLWLYLRRLPNRNAWRAVMLGLIVALLGLPSLVQTSRGVDVFVLADRSRSVGDEGLQKENELIGLIARRLGEGDRLGIVSFNDRAHVERAPGGAAAFEGFNTPYSPDASDLGEGLRTVLAQVQPGRQSRVLILSDGEYTGPSPMREARLAARDGVKLYYRDLNRLELFNLSIRDALLPEKIMTGEPFRVAFRVEATQAAAGRYRLYRNDKIIGEEEDGGWRPHEFEPGENLISFHDAAGASGIYQYRLEVQAPGVEEPFTGDNSAERYVQAVGERPLLLINNTGAPDNVSAVLSAGGLQHSIMAIGSMPLTIGMLDGYKGVILNNVSILGLSFGQIEALRNFAVQEGGGLLVCGGNRSFASGGYYKSALDPILPVSLEDRQESKKISTAFSIVIDRSGSMSVETPSGKQKIELAGAAAAECINLMSSADSISLIPVDSAAHLLIRQQPVTDRGALMRTARSIESMGGGIYVYTGLVAAGSQILKAPQLNKHILLFSDACDSEEPGDYKNLIEKFKKAGVTVSVVGLGSESDCDAAFLKDIAERGEGSVYFTVDAQQLVQFFTADTITYTRNSFIEEPSPMAIEVGAFALAPDQQWADFTSSHYNLLFARPKAEIAIRTGDEDAAPVLAFWQSGLGRVAALALDPEQVFADTGNYGDIVLGACRWIMGSDVADNLQIRTQYEGNYAAVSMEIAEEERDAIGTAEIEIFTPGGRVERRPMQWTGVDRLQGEIKLSETGLYRGVIHAGGKVWKIGPVSLPVSPEFQYNGEAGEGRRTLAALAAAAGGAEVLDMRELFEGEGVSRSSQPFTLPLLMALCAFMLLEIAEPRFGLLGLIRAGAAGGWTGLKSRWRASREPGRTLPAGRRMKRKPRKKTESAPGAPAPDKTSESSAPDASPSPDAAPKTPPPTPPGTAGGMSYLKASKHEAEKKWK